MLILSDVIYNAFLPGFLFGAVIIGYIFFQECKKRKN